MVIDVLMWDLHKLFFATLKPQRFHGIHGHYNIGSTYRFCPGGSGLVVVLEVGQPG